MENMRDVHLGIPGNWTPRDREIMERRLGFMGMTYPEYCAEVEQAIHDTFFAQPAVKGCIMQKALEVAKLEPVENQKTKA